MQSFLVFSNLTGYTILSGDGRVIAAVLDYATDDATNTTRRSETVLNFGDAFSTQGHYASLIHLCVSGVLLLLALPLLIGTFNSHRARQKLELEFVTVHKACEEVAAALDEGRKQGKGRRKKKAVKPDVVAGGSAAEPTTTRSNKATLSSHSNAAAVAAYHNTAMEGALPEATSPASRVMVVGPPPSQQQPAMYAPPNQAMMYPTNANTMSNAAVAGMYPAGMMGGNGMNGAPPPPSSSSLPRVSSFASVNGNAMMLPRTPSSMAMMNGPRPLPPHQQQQQQMMYATMGSSNTGSLAAHPQPNPLYPMNVASPAQQPQPQLWRGDVPPLSSAMVQPYSQPTATSPQTLDGGQDEPQRLRRRNSKVSFILD